MVKQTITINGKIFHAAGVPHGDNQVTSKKDAEKWAKFQRLHNNFTTVVRKVDGGYVVYYNKQKSYTKIHKPRIEDLTSGF